ncbi:hypothetical protein [Polyangium sp. 6x1]|uniref:hypothetical protein n=1 Tax=Polyangium sp. 6x1 TaxID=3042689 RepID=UPI002482AE6C|nr:hypothetical protein [Polyangium sp. 6x1]MDI1442650.1 hypothetical protein [Polyangium sp. 6x1]
MTHEQTKPNVYAATARGDIHLHFMGMKGLNPAEAYSTCLVLVPEIETLHQTFSDALRRLYGKLPIAGQPRITRLRKGQSRFTVVDVAGNSVIFIKHGAPDDDDEGATPQSHSRLGKALRAAARLRDFRNDDAAAAKVLDLALAHDGPSDRIERARALAARLELSLAMHDEERARTLQTALSAMALHTEERAQVPELLAVDWLERSQR